MRAPTTRTRLLIALVALLFSYANMLCATRGSALNTCEHSGADNHCDHSESAHHDHTPSPQPKDCSKDSCFCITMNTVVTQQTVTQPNHASLRVVDFTFAELPVTIPALRAVVAYEHGPPSIAPPQYLSGKTLSPRAPPLGA